MRLIPYLFTAAILVPTSVTAQDLYIPTFMREQSAVDTADYSQLLRLATQGEAQAQLDIGRMYWRGLNASVRDLSRGVRWAQTSRWIRSAALQGHAEAQYLFGHLHSSGIGVPQDYGTAHMWYNIAFANGFINAADDREIMERRMTAAGIAEAQRRARVCMTSSFQDCD